MIARINVVFKMAFWNKEIETMPREELEKMQLSLLRAKVREMYDGCRFDTLSITYSNNTQTRGKTDEVLIRPKRYVDAG